MLSMNEHKFIYVQVLPSNDDDDDNHIKIIYKWTNGWRGDERDWVKEKNKKIDKIGLISILRRKMSKCLR